MSSYNEYKNCPASVGRLLHLLAAYNRSCRGVDELIFGDEKILHRGKLLAHFKFNSKTDLHPIFEFETLSPDKEIRDWAKQLKKSEFFLKPWMDLPNYEEQYIEGNYFYAIQEIKKYLTIHDAEFITWIRDKHNSDFKLSVQLEISKSIENKIVNFLKTKNVYDGYEKRGFTKLYENWTHVALCAVYGLKSEDDE